jgi:hypothetical protein
LFEDRNPLKSIIVLSLRSRKSQIEGGTCGRLPQDLDALEVYLYLHAPRCAKLFDQSGRKFAGNSAPTTAMPIAGSASDGITC